MKKIAFLLLGLLGFGCSASTSPVTGGTETGNTQAAVTLRLAGYQTSQPAALALLTVGDSAITSARVVVGRITFKPMADCGGNSEGAEEKEIDGPFIADLLNPESLADLENISIPAGRYCRIVLVLRKLEDDESHNVASGDPLLDHSLWIEGTREDATPFQVTSSVDQNFELTNGANGFELQASSLPQIFFIGFDLDQWFSGVDLMDESLELSNQNGNSLLQIDDDHNQDTQETIEDNLKRSSDLFKDSDGNEHLDSDEREDSLAEGKDLP